MTPLKRFLPSLMLPLLSMTGLGVSADEPEVLQINPFKRPLLENKAPAPGRGGNVETAAVPPTPLVLEATLLGSRMPLARIDGKIVSVGDTLADYTVKAIRPGEVTLSKNNQTLVLRLDQSTATKKAAHE